MQSEGPKYTFHLGIRSAEKERGWEMRVLGTVKGQRFGAGAGSQGLEQLHHFVFIPVSNPPLTTPREEKETQDKVVLPASWHTWCSVAMTRMRAWPQCPVGREANF